MTYDTGDYPRALETALDAVGYDALRAQQAARRARGAPTWCSGSGWPPTSRYRVPVEGLGQGRGQTPMVASP